MNENKTTNALNNILKKSGASGLKEYFEDNAGELADADRPFASYMRKMFRKKGLSQQDIFLAADIPERYGYKLISEEKHTVQRDAILRICIAAGFSLTEVQRALKLYGMSPLYARVPRDAVLIIAFNTGLSDIAEMDDLLAKHDMELLYSCSGIE